jgi:hypothetical protein
MSLLRLARGAGRRGLDEDFAWLAVPVPGAGRFVSALGEVIHRRVYGPLEKLGVRFQYIAPDERALLDGWLGGDPA